MEQKIQRSILQFASWFNSPLLSDIEIFSSKSSNARSFHCHQIVIYLNSPTLLDALLKNEINKEKNQNVIIDELVDKPQETELFLMALYSSSVLDTVENATMARFLSPLIQKYSLRLSKKDFLPQEIIPKPNSNTILSDFKLTIKGKNEFYNCHRLFLALSSEYFRGLLTSEMRDSNVRESEISSPILNPTDIADNMNHFIDSIYYGRVKYPINRSAFVGLLLSEQYLTSVSDNWKKTILQQIDRQHCTEMIQCAIEFNRSDFLEVATEYLFKDIAMMAKDGNLNLLSKDYLESISDGGSNIVQACLRSAKDSGCRNALKIIMEKVGPSSPISLVFTDEAQTTALHMACKEPKPKTLKFLLEQGLTSQINAKDKLEMTPLDVILANFSTNDEIVKRIQRCISVLLSYNANMPTHRPFIENFVHSSGNFTDLDPSINIVKTILDNISPKDYADSYQKAVTVALAEHHIEMVYYFLMQRQVQFSLQEYRILTEGYSLQEERARRSPDPSGNVQRVRISTKDPEHLVIDGGVLDITDCTLQHNEVEVDVGSYQDTVTEHQLRFTVLGETFVFVSKPTQSVIGNFLQFYADLQEYHKAHNYVPPKNKINHNNNHNNSEEEDTDVNMADASANSELHAQQVIAMVEAILQADKKERKSNKKEKAIKKHKKEKKYKK